MGWPWEDGDYPSQTFNRSDNVRITITPDEHINVTMCALQYVWEGSMPAINFEKQDDGTYVADFNAEEYDMDQGGNCWIAFHGDIDDPNITITWENDIYDTITVEVIE